jgi:predicted dehydrogenase
MARARAFSNIEGVTLAGVVSRHQESADRAAAEFGIPVAGTDVDTAAAQAKPDAVVIAVHNAYHHPYIMWALEHDLPVFVDGPMVVSSAQAAEVVALAQERGLTVEVGFQRRYHPVIRRARDLIQGGQYGPLIYGEVEFLWHMTPAPGEPDPWYLSQQTSGGMAVSHMSYGLNTLRWVLGNPVRVYAAGNSLAFTKPGQVSDETLAVTLMYADGAVASVVANYSAPPDFPSGMMKAHCLTGGFALQIIQGVHGTFWEGEARAEIAAAPTGELSFGADDLQAQCEAFARALNGEPGLLNPPQDSLFELQLIESVLESAHRGMPVDLP